MNNNALLKQKQEHKKIYFLLGRAIIAYICLFIIYMFLWLHNIVDLENPLLIVILVIIMIIYTLSIIVFNNFIKLKDINGNIFTYNLLSLLLSCIFSYTTLYTFLKISKIYAEAALGYFFGLVLLVIFVVPAMFIINLIIDLICKKKHK